MTDADARALVNRTATLRYGSTETTVRVVGVADQRNWGLYLVTDDGRAIRAETARVVGVEGDDMSVAAPCDEIEYVDLDSLSTLDLLKERSDVLVNIAEIQAQLRDKNRRPITPEDDSPAWDAYRDWRRRARWALVHRKKELEAIKRLLRERHDIQAAARSQRIEAGQPSEKDAAWLERERLLNEALAAQSDEAMLLWSYRIMRRLLADYVNALPDCLDQDDRDHLVMLGMRLRRTYGVGRLKAFCAETETRVVGVEG